METPSLVAGIGIGIAIGIMLGFVISPGSSVSAPSVIDEIFETVVEPEPRFAELQAYYDENDDRITVVMYLTDNDDNYVKADGDVEITLCKDEPYSDRLTGCFFRTFNFEKDDFYTREGQTGHQFVIVRELRGGGTWDIRMDINVPSLDARWTDVGTSVYALEY